MSLVLLPVLLEAMGQFFRMKHDADDVPADGDDFGRFSLIMAVSLVATDFNLPSLILFLIFDPDTLLHPKSLMFLSSWFLGWISIRYFEALHGVWTRGEWMITSAMIAMVCTECFAGLFTAWDEHHVHQLVALAGWMSCLVGCILGHALEDLLEALQHRHSSIAIRQEFILPMTLFAIMLVSFSGIELIMSQNPTTADAIAYPRSINWIIDFLFHAELAPVHILGMPLWRRVTWIIYWVVVVLLAIPLAPNNSPIIARKWFHAFAIILFVPVSLSTPILQSLGYAIAMAVLMVLECVRHDIPVLNAFYERYIDEGKDGKTSHCVIVSHMCLIFGCAAPLWIADILDLQESHAETMGLLSLWGVLCLGVGDSMGAVIGKSYGRIGWGKSRTVEGSIAMLISMLALYFIMALHFDLFGTEHAHYWIPAMCFVTLLEAFTHQIDNMVLPLAGVAVILMSRQFFARNQELG